MSALAAIGQAQLGSARAVRVDPERRLLGVVMREPSGDLSADEDVAHGALSKLVRRGAMGLNIDPQVVVVESFVSPIAFSYDGGRTTVAKDSWVVVIAFTRAAWQRLLPRLDRMGLAAPVPVATVQPAAALAKTAPVADPGAIDPEGVEAIAEALGAIAKIARLASRPAPIHVHVPATQIEVHPAPIHVKVEPPPVHVKVEPPKRGPVRVETLADGSRRFIPEDPTEGGAT
jgi:hypothetical protein